MLTLLYDIKAAAERNEGALPEEARRKQSDKDGEIPRQWRKENSRRKHVSVQKTELTLMSRLQINTEAHLPFLHDREVSFGNNHSERAIHLSKAHYTITGGYGTHEYDLMCCRIFIVALTRHANGATF